MTAESVPPQTDEVEISVFGPGYGECVLIHLGGGEWLIVDSCVDPDSGEQPALRYLKQLGIDPRTGVKTIVASHWHDDHIRGLAELVRTCTDALFYCSDALSEEETLVFLGTQGPHTYRSGAREFRNVLDALKDRKLSGRASRSITPIKWVIEGRSILSTQSGSSEPNIQVLALSPSDASVSRARMTFRNLIPNAGESPRRVPSTEPNDNAIVLWLLLGDVAILLGADLEEGTRPQVGWSAVLNSFSLQESQVFKVPHHGSSNAHHDGVWNNMLQPQPYALLTPFDNGSAHLPTPADIRRICSLTDNAYITAVGSRSRPKKRDKAVEKTMNEVTKRRVVLEPRSGHVRLRRDNKNGSTSAWAVDLFGGAEKLKPPT